MINFKDINKSPQMRRIKDNNKYLEQKQNSGKKRIKIIAKLIQKSAKTWKVII